MLETINLPGSGKTTTRLGFGCSGLMGGLSERESLRLLDTAFDAGIRHFDVAPSYGHGRAEYCLGKFLRDKAGKVTVTTKYGILPPRQAGVLDIARQVARPLLRRLPGVRHRAAQAVAALKTKAGFSAEEAQISLDRSLRQLGLDSVDLWLLHEATADDLDHSDLLEWLQKKKQQGKIRAYGVGTERQNLAAVWQRHRDYCPVLQFESSVVEDRPFFPGALSIHHRTVSGALGPIGEAFRRDPGLSRRWSNELNLDLTDAQMLAALLLRTSLWRNLNGLVLFSSRTPAHIQTNVHVAENPAWTSRAMHLLELLDRESRPINPPRLRTNIRSDHVP